MDNELLLNAIDAAAATAYGSDRNSNLSVERALAIKYYLGKNVDPADEGRSQVVDRTIYETIQWILPSLTRIYANGDDVITITPEGPDDEERAQQETDYLNWVITQKNPWFDIITTWCHDALLTKNAYCLAYWDNIEHTEIESYEKQTDESLQYLLQDDEIKIIKQKSYPDPDQGPQPIIGPNGQPQMEPVLGQDGQAVMQVVQGPDGQPNVQPAMQPVLRQPMMHHVEIKRLNKRGQVCLKVIPPERVLVSERTPGVQLIDCPYFEYWEMVHISDLRAMGYKIADDIASTDNPDELEDLARDQFMEQQRWNAETNPIDPAMRIVKCRMIWIKFDSDGDGISEQQYIIRVGREILHQEEVSRIPVGVLVPNPLPHRHMGQSIADTTVDIQQIKTSILRQGLDNLYQTNNFRTFATDKINLDDLLVSRPGGVVRGQPGAVYGQDIAPMQTPFVFPQAMEGLQYMDSVREARTGTNKAFMGLDPNVLNKTATGMQMASTMAAQRVEQIARLFAPGIEYLFSCAHELIIKHGHKKETIRLRNKWIEVDPSTWRNRADMRIKVGYAAGNKDAMIGRLANILGMQQQAIQIGVATPQNIYNALIEMTKASDFSSPERFWTDPSLQPPQPPPPPDPRVQAAQIKSDGDLKLNEAQLQKELILKNIEIKDRTAQRLSQESIAKYATDADAAMKLRLAAMQHEGGFQLETHKARLEAAVNDAKEGTSTKIDQLSQSTDIVAQIAQENKDQTDQILQALQQMGAMLQETIKAVNTPKRLVRGKDGKVTGAIPDPTLQ